MSFDRNAVYYRTSSQAPMRRSDYVYDRVYDPVKRVREAQILEDNSRRRMWKGIRFSLMLTLPIWLTFTGFVIWLAFHW